MQPQVITLPTTGFVRKSLLLGNKKTGTPGILPFSESTLWRHVKQGKFPAPYHLSERVTAWKAEEVRAWLDQQG